LDVDADTTIHGLPLDGAVVRLRVHHPAEEAVAFAEGIKQDLEGLGAWVAQVKIDALRPVRARVAGLDDSLSPVDAARLWAVTNAEDVEMVTRRTAEYLEASDG
jgi:hypothetical protein